MLFVLKVLLNESYRNFFTNSAVTRKGNTSAVRHLTFNLQILNSYLQQVLDRLWIQLNQEDQGDPRKKGKKNRCFKLLLQNHSKTEDNRQQKTRDPNHPRLRALSFFFYRAMQTQLRIRHVLFSFVSF